MTQPTIDVIKRMRAALLSPEEWAEPCDIPLCVPSTLAALEACDYNLALTRWNDLIKTPDIGLKETA